MHFQHRTTARVRLAAGLLLTLAPALGAQAPALPKAEDLAARYVAAIGGETALTRHTSMRTLAQFEMAAQGLKGDVELLQAKPNLMASKTTIPGLGDITAGFDGTTAWSVNPMQGPRVVEGKELAAIREAADWSNLTLKSGAIQSMQTVEQTTIAGQPCYKVKINWKSGRESFDCFAVDGGLIVARVEKNETPMGSVEITTTLAEYKDFEGLKLPTITRQSAMGAEQVLTIRSVEFDKVDPAAFELPATIKTLVKKP